MQIADQDQAQISPVPPHLIDLIPTVPFTPRQEEILGLVAEGCSDKEIASRLDLSCRTVSKHLERLYDKLGFRNRTIAAVVWITWSYERRRVMSREEL
jgi:DNA-binding NarL/FixJ family response regulator